MILFLLMCIAASATWYVWQRSVKFASDTPLQTLILINMVLITVFGGALLSIGPRLTTNCGNIWYANVMLLQFLIMRRFGWDHGLRCLVQVFACLLMLWAVMLVIRDAAGSDALGRAYVAVIDNAHRVAVASFFAFWLGQGVFVALYRVWQARPLWISYGASMVLAQAVDSLVFFPLAFGGDVAHIMVVGFALKAALGLLALPFLGRALGER